jgi:catechol 2,3-dioxygenase
MEYTAVPDHPEVVIFAMTTTCERAHDLGIVRDFAGHRGRVNHFAYFADSREELIRAADIFLNQGIGIEYGPGRHGMGDQDYLYVRDPSGMRVELNAGGYRNYEPDWEPVQFDSQFGSLDFYLNRPLPDSFSESFPPVAGPPPSAEEMREQTGYIV